MVQAIILSKMHMLEAQMVPWLKQCRVGLGLMGEQGPTPTKRSIPTLLTGLEVKIRTS